MPTEPHDRRPAGGPEARSPVGGHEDRPGIVASDDRPPVGGTWGRLYAVELGVLAALILLFAVLTGLYQ